MALPRGSQNLGFFSLDGKINTSGGDLYSEGVNLTVQGFGLTTANGGNVDLRYTGNVTILSNGVVTGGGSFYSEGQDLSITQGGLNTSGGTGGDVTLVHTGYDITIESLFI